MLKSIYTIVIMNSKEVDEEIKADELLTIAINR
jgi:hypothetical protein